MSDKRNLAARFFLLFIQLQGKYFPNKFKMNKKLFHHMLGAETLKTFI